MPIEYEEMSSQTHPVTQQQKPELQMLAVSEKQMTATKPSTDAQNASAVAAGAAALGAVVALTVSTGLVGPIVGAVVGGVLGGISGNNINRTVRWWSAHHHHDVSSNNH